jgi:hypothetical protein
MAISGGKKFLKVWQIGAFFHQKSFLGVTLSLFLSTNGKNSPKKKVLVLLCP